MKPDVDALCERRVIVYQVGRTCLLCFLPTALRAHGETHTHDDCLLNFSTSALFQDIVFIMPEAEKSGSRGQKNRALALVQEDEKTVRTGGKEYFVESVGDESPTRATRDGVKGKRTRSDSTSGLRQQAFPLPPGSEDGTAFPLRVKSSFC